MAVKQPPEPTFLQRRVQAFIDKYGSVRAAAEALDISHPYLYRLSTGELENPSASTLKKLRLRRVVTYEDAR